MCKSASTSLILLCVLATSYILQLPFHVECSYETACQAFALSQLAIVPVCTLMCVSSGGLRGVVI